jgi:hypothetical protein
MIDSSAAAPPPPPAAPPVTANKAHWYRPRCTHKRSIEDEEQGVGAGMIAQSKHACYFKTLVKFRRTSCTIVCPGG